MERDQLEALFQIMGENLSASSGLTLHCPAGFARIRQRGGDGAGEKYVSYGAFAARRIARRSGHRVTPLVPDDRVLVLKT